MSTAQPLMAGAIVALVLMGAIYALYRGLLAQRNAAAAVAENGSLTALLQASPALAVIVRADGRVDAPEQFGDWLGLTAPPRYLADLAGEAGGLSARDADALAAEIAATQKSGRPFSRSVRAIGASRTLMIRGAKAASELRAPGGVVLWVFDATETLAEIERLSDEVAAAHRAFDVLTGLIQAAPMPMWYRGADMRLAMVNSHYADAVDAADPEDAVARGLELLEGGGRGGPLAGAVAARDTNRLQVKAMPATIKGERRMLRVYDVPMPDGGVAGFAVDIEDLEQARAAIKRLGETERATLDRLSAGVAQFGADRALTFFNQPFQRIFGIESEWLADSPEFDRVLEHMRERNRLPEVRDFPGWKAERRGWFVATGGVIEEQWHLPGGVHLRVVAQPLPDGGLLLIFEDRTEQVQLASGLDTLLRVRTATFENLFEALGVFAADGRLQLWNNKFRMLWDLDEAFLATHPRVDALAEKAAPRLANPDRAALIGDLVRAATVERQQRGGQVRFADGRYFEFAAVPLPDGNGLFTMLDTTDRRRIETALRDRNEALEAADRVKTSFVANMSYELRTPLTSISGFAEMLSAGYGGKLNDTAASYVDAILESVQRLGALVDDVLDLTQSDEPEPAAVREEVDLVPLARGAARAVAPLADRRKLEFVVEVMPSAGIVRGDSRRIRQVIEHLLRHAVAGTPPGGRILLHVDGDSSAARIVVSDDGAGMSPQDVARAFDRFAQPGVTRDGERALGLGLPLAKQFVEAHGGTIELLSEPGAGTAITVLLPRNR
ncbi:PAS domain-containing sensor histidine kinase [Sphingomonas sp. NFR15]|uniref:sensor histidine kinase n=1 Tax=Sphingomonas sp. NFR15 TaxID=1566282 RepID=UPI00088B22B0|nr:PAS domain-containing sensor histidine kinase [Sphingomonas sp. NFR15]SDA29568.1 Signal transduction histidine kinase [Sphingomonas sp. NFR15]